MRISKLFVAAFLSLGALCGPVAAQQDWPNRPIKIVWPFPPGGSDGVVRLLAERLTHALGQAVVVDPKGGAGGNIGAEQVARSPADGYTLLMGTNGALAINSSLYKSMRFDPQKDFTPISGYVSAPQVLFANPAVPANTLGELVALSKAKPESLTYASVGTGSASHLTMELLKSLTGAQIMHVPYKGAGPAIADVIGGQVSMMTVIAGSALPHVKAGNVKAIAVTSAKPSSLVPGVQTMAEAGVAGMEARAWLALVAPAGTPRPIIERLNAEVGRFLQDPGTKDRLAAMGFEPWPTRVEELGSLMRAERDMWSKIIESTGARAD
ncbi:MAG: Bug family tripartite tricarboxylate transporter substrate binding protein [Lautropia sp.]